jgi:hypothetical protein
LFAKGEHEDSLHGTRGKPMPGDRILSFFDRTQLFEALWTVSMVDLGKKYGISGATVQRVCGALEIPIQSGGHSTRAVLPHLKCINIGLSMMLNSRGSLGYDRAPHYVLPCC